MNQFGSCLTSHHWLSGSAHCVSLSLFLPVTIKTFTQRIFISWFNAKEAEVTIKAKCVFAVAQAAAFTVCQRHSGLDSWFPQTLWANNMGEVWADQWQRASVKDGGFATMFPLPHPFICWIGLCETALSGNGWQGIRHHDPEISFGFLFLVYKWCKRSVWRISSCTYCIYIYASKNVISV